MRTFDEKHIRLAFHIGLWMKGLFASVEIVGGVTALFITQTFLVSVANAITQGELTEDPSDFLANYLRRSAQHLSVGTQYFAALYLLAHGIIKLWLVTGLLRQRFWYYPTALIVFGFFILYQVYRFTETHSLALVFISAVDMVVIGLTWHEYRYLRRVANRAKGN